MKDWILIVDDDEQIVDVMTLVLESEGYLVRSCSSRKRALDLVVQQEYALALLDLRLAGDNGLDILPALREASPNTPVFIITAHGDVDSAVQAFGLGAAGYVRKPFQDGDLKAQIAQAVETYRVRRELQGEVNPGAHEHVRAILRARDPAMEPVLKRVATAAQVSSSVVVTGESGTGKELVARALHRCGPRRSQPFVAFNCSAVPENLIESELFGHARGAFTDAKEAKPGLFARAHGGTIFLDEIGDAPASIQSKLLRALQEKEILPVGATAPVKIDVRVIAATHRSLKHEVEQGRFRHDLYYRLHVLPIHVPPLRERPKDILYLASVFAGQLSQKLSVGFDGFTAAAERALTEHAWPGNVRELQNRIEHSLAVTRGGILSARSLFPEDEEAPEDSSQAAPEPVLDADALPSFMEAKHSFEKTYLERLLTAARGNIAKAARLASKSRTEVYSLLRKHGINAGEFKG